MKLLINEIKVLKSFIGGVQRNMDFLTWKPYLEQANEKWIFEAFGEDLIDDLFDDNPGNEYKAELKNKIQRALAWYAYLIAIPQMTIVTSDAGMIQPSPSNSTVITKWMFVNLVSNAARNADEALEGALAYLGKHEDKKIENSDVFIFDTWRKSDVFKKMQNMFVKSASELTIYLPMANNNRRMYLAMLPYIEQVEKSELCDMFGTGFVHVMRNEVASQDKDNVFVLDNFKMIIVYKALVNSLVYLNLSEDFRIITVTEGLTKEGMLENIRATQIKLDAELIIQKHYHKLLDFLTENASENKFKEFFSSSLYKNKEHGKNGAKERVLSRFGDKNRNFVRL